jgi:hypothetical protein
VSISLPTDAVKNLRLIPAEHRPARRWAVWRTETAPGQLFEERYTYLPFKEYPGIAALPRATHRTIAKEGADLTLALAYLAFRPGEYEGIAYLREDGSTDYYPASAAL